ncbi:MAG: hypothetical protein JST04_03100 [Bdellovibrionales bacterium]|nr:hypothetical protein [Bdellovibrionales bacterium]
MGIRRKSRKENSPGRWRRLFSRADPHAGIGVLLSHAGDKMDLSERMVWASRILVWLRPTGEGGGEARFRFFFNLLEQNPEFRKNLRAACATLVRDCSFLHFFLDTGYTNDHGLWTEAFNRALDRLLPAAATNDVRAVWAPVLREPSDSEWVGEWPDDVLKRFAELLTGDEFEPLWKDVQSDLGEALLLLSTNVVHHGLSLGLQRRMRRRRPIMDAPFLAFSSAVRHSVRARKPAEDFAESARACRAEITEAYRELETSGVSVGAVHRLETMSAAIDRIELLLGFWTESSAKVRNRKIAAYLAEMGLVSTREQSVGAHIGRHFYLLSRKIAERNGQSGEHYIARNPGEMRALFVSALGGGLVVVGMTFFKLLIRRLGLAPIFEAFGFWIVYSGGFLAMQALGFTLATKIPSFAASRLAQWLRDARSKNDARLFAKELGEVVKSQFVGLIGNVLTVVPAAWGIHYLLHQHFGLPSLMKPEYAEHFVHGMNPIAGAALFLGALTGVELWASSICGGWFENFVVFRGIPDAIASHPRFVKIFGAESARKYADRFLKESSGLATNVSLGFMFGFVPLLGTLSGFSLESAHVTIATASTAFAATTEGLALTRADLLWAGAGLALVGTMNFTVSFFLALLVAVRAQNVKRAWVGHFLGSIWRRSRGKRAP